MNNIRYPVLLMMAILLAAAWPAFTQDARADKKLVVIVHPDNPVTQISRVELEKIFMGKRGFWEWGKPIRTADLIEQENKEEDSSRAIFATEFLGKNLAILKSYWIRAIFSGKGQPPLVFGKTEDVVKFVEDNVGAIAYIRRKDMEPARVKALAIIEHAEN